MPPRIDASPEAVARMLVTSPPKKEREWQYPEKYGNDPVGDDSACRRPIMPATVYQTLTAP